MATLVVSAGYQDEGAAAGVAKLAAAEDSLAAKTLAKSQAIKSAKQAEAAEARRLKQQEMNEWKAAENEKDRMLTREIAKKKMTYDRLAELDKRRYDEERAQRKQAERETGGGGRGIFGGRGGGGGGMLSGMAGGIAGMIGLGGLTAAIATMTASFNAQRDKQLELARQGEATGVAMKSFIGLQDSRKYSAEERNKAVESAIKLGAKEGLTPEQTSTTAEPLQSLFDTNGIWDKEEDARFVPNARMQKLGVDAETAGGVSVLANARKLAPGEAEDKIVYASAISAENETAVARSAAIGGSQFSTFEDALGATAALSAAGVGGVGGSLLPAALGTLNKTVGVGGETKYPAMFKKYGLGTYGGKEYGNQYLQDIGMDPSLKGKDKQAFIDSLPDDYYEEYQKQSAPLNERENVQRLREVAVAEGDPTKTDNQNIEAFSMDLAKRLGVKDTEDSRALGAVMRGFDKWDEVTTGIAKGEAAGAVDQKLAALKENPITKATLEGEKQAAARGVQGIYGEQADKSRDTQVDARKGGLWHMASGGPRQNMLGWDFVDDQGNETGMGMGRRGIMPTVESISKYSGLGALGGLIGGYTPEYKTLGVSGAQESLDATQNTTIDAMGGGGLPEAAKAMNDAAAALKGVTEVLGRNGTQASATTATASTPAPINRNAGE